MDSDRATPATKGDIDDLRRETKEQIADLRTEMKEQIADLRTDMTAMKEEIAMVRSEMHHIYDELRETIHDGQTSLLQAFYSFAQSNQTRLTDSEREAATLKERMAIYEQRLTDLERKVNFPQQPPQA
jgi:uncharacterized protein involved in exopolysaccharide biosynthesis